MRVLLIDNYDSFTYNLEQYLGELGAQVWVMRNDELSIADITKVNPDRIMISPGPGTPSEAGISMNVIKSFAGKTPILGICLGHQCIAQVFDGKVIHAPTIIHGKTSDIHHEQQGVFKNMPSPFKATRYHSLLVEEKTLPECFEITAWSYTQGFKEIMGIKHKSLNLEGIQFHPESIMTEYGHELLENFLGEK